MERSFKLNLFIFGFLWMLTANLQAAGWALTAEGYGDTVELAQKNAYAALVQRIRSEVKATTSQTVSDSNGAVNRKAQRSIEVKADLLIKGVTYEPAVKQGKEFQTLAILSLPALSETLAYYDKSTQFDPMGVNNEQRENLYQQVLKWQALLTLAPKIVENLEVYQSNLETRLSYLDALRTAALIKVKVTPLNAKLTLDGDLKTLNQPLVVSPGVHRLSLQADGYQELVKQVQINRGQALLVVESLVSKSVQGKNLTIQIAPELRDLIPEDGVATLMADVGWQAVTNSPYQLKVLGSVMRNETSGFIRYQFQFDVGVYKNDAKMKKVKFKTSVTVRENQDTAEVVWHQASKKVAQAIHLLAANIQF